MASEFNMMFQEHQILGHLQYDLEVPCVRGSGGLLWFLAPTKLYEYIRKDGTVRPEMNKALDHALRAAIEHPFEARHTPRHCILDIFRDLRFEVDDYVDITGKEMDGREFGGCPHSWRRRPRPTT